MKIQSIGFLTRTNYRNNVSFSRKYVQPDSFINMPKRVNKSKEIDDYLSSSKKEVKNLQKTAKAHYKQCMKMLAKASLIGYEETIEADEYNINFGRTDEKTNLPSSINIWQDGRLIQQYSIEAMEPVSHIKVFDCENKDFLEDYTIINGKLVTYVATKPKENKAEVVISSGDNFFKIEGTMKSNSCDIIQIAERKELMYNSDGSGVFIERKKDSDQGYSLNSKDKKWKNIPVEHNEIIEIKK